MATIKQMKARMLPFHRQVLESVRDGGDAVSEHAPDSELRGYMRVRRTLIEWGAIDQNGLTSIGKELIA